MGTHLGKWSRRGKKLFEYLVCPFLESASLASLAQKLHVNNHYVRVYAEVMVLTGIDNEIPSYLTGFEPEANALSL